MCPKPREREKRREKTRKTTKHKKNKLENKLSSGGDDQYLQGFVLEMLFFSFFLEAFLFGLPEVFALGEDLGEYLENTRGTPRKFKRNPEQFEGNTNLGVGEC